MKKTEKMQLRKTLKSEIEKMSNETNVSPLLFITKMQGIAALNKDEKTLEILCDLKRDYYNFNV